MLEHNCRRPFLFGAVLMKFVFFTQNSETPRVEPRHRYR